MKLSSHCCYFVFGTLFTVVSIKQCEATADVMLRLRKKEDIENKDVKHHRIPSHSVLRRELQDETPIWSSIESILNGDILPDDMLMSMASDMPSDVPSMMPSYILMTSDKPSQLPTSMVLPTLTPSSSPMMISSSSPILTASLSPTMASSSSPMMISSSPPILTASLSPTMASSLSITTFPSITATDSPSSDSGTDAPTLFSCPGLTEDERIEQILAILDTVADPDKIRDNSVPQGLATTWLLSNDEYMVCPTVNPDCSILIQRWTLAVMYYSMGGDSWFQCSANPNATDPCGDEKPFEGDERFLSPVSYCEWAGITCIDECVTEIDYEINNLAGTIATEIGLLNDLAVWGMQRGNLTGTIPTEIGKLSDLIFIDLDFNELTGTLSAELYSLTNLTQLDLNDNKFTGNIEGLGGFPFMEFLQIHRNGFTGTIPAGVGTYTDMETFTLHETMITGTVPTTLCDLLITNGGILSSLIADCGVNGTVVNPKVECECCTDCRP